MSYNSITSDLNETKEEQGSIPATNEYRRERREKKRFIMPSQHRLTRAQRIHAQGIIDAAASGTYTVRQLFGDKWQLILRKTSFGRWFRQSVITEELKRIIWRGRASNKSHKYEVNHE